MKRTAAERRSALDELQARVGYRFGDARLLADALTHASALPASGPRPGERLEFLGDAVLGLVLSDLLVARYPDLDEGRLSRARAALVNTASAAARARELGLDRVLELGRGEEKSGGRRKASILAAGYEALLGAIFLDGGYDAARAVVARHFRDLLGAAHGLSLPDPKTALQEACQERYRLAPVYCVVEARGPDHARRFLVEVRLGDAVLGRGEGTSKRDAEQAAARQALERGLPPGGLPADG